ncbi:hypothetical protein DFP72DRAFT_1095119 [Ephemerocybe angulata]|uniref:Uncharacterized protein n=1 Tax=Ephemerocybe angulata TaxID=980116 RepID=A0A8H6HCH7_9AGAR|nr:hypothetical protein DFP72DRAFT_1095119 [Tulosesus angulatus]
MSSTSSALSAGPSARTKKAATCRRATAAALASMSQFRPPKSAFKEDSPDASKENLFAPISLESMSNVLYHFCAGIFTHGEERVWYENDFFHWVVQDQPGLPGEVWQMSVFAGILLLQRYRAINTLRGGLNSASHTPSLLCAFPIDAVVYSAAMMGLQYCVTDLVYRSVDVDWTVGRRRGTHERCKVAMLRGLEWNMLVTGRDLEKFRNDVIGAGCSASLHNIIVSRPLGYYGGPSRETLVLDDRMGLISKELEEAGIVYEKVEDVEADKVYGDGAVARDQAPQGIMERFLTLILWAVGYS